MFVAVPFLDIKTQYEEIKSEVEPAVLEVLSSAAYVLGPKVEAFEKALAEYCGTEQAIGLASGTDALILILDALGIGPGDEVVTTPFTFFATAESISRVGAKPVFVDIEPDTFNIDPRLVEKALSSRTKAIMPVHLFGRLADMKAINSLAEERGVHVIEDACQAIGASRDGVKAGALGTAAAFSFYPTKNLGAVGDGGAVTTNDPALADRIRLLRDHGSPKRYFHAALGYNSRLDAIQAVVLSIKLSHLDAWNDARRGLADRYSKSLEHLGITVPSSSDSGSHAYHLYTCRSRARDAIVGELQKRSIGCGVYYPLPLHLQEVYRKLGYHKGSLPEAERAAGEVFSLPMYPELTAVQVDETAEAVRSAAERAGT
ncbi:MAG: DegT/DnrJ/EryC1/StrS family aminotransferase [Candidatus Aquicultorales bacterium]